MPLPELDRYGDLPVGAHQASLDEVIARFGHGTPKRQLVTNHATPIATTTVSHSTSRIVKRNMGAGS